MFEFFDFVINLIQTVIQYIGTLVESVISFIVQMFTASQFITATIAFLPPFCQGALIAIIGISTLLMLLGSFIDAG